MNLHPFEIKNDYVLNILSKIEKNVLEYDWSSQEICSTSFKENYNQHRDYHLSEEYLQKMIAKGESHEGHPEQQPVYYNSWHPVKNEQNLILKRELMEYMFVGGDVLDTFYPPGSFCSWHNNANAAGWGIMFTWSETGEGDFRYWDQDKKEVVIIPDKKGWFFKYYYFGHYREPEKVVYHACSNDCLRYSFAFNYYNHKDVLDDTIEMLKTK